MFTKPRIDILWGRAKVAIPLMMVSLVWVGCSSPDLSGPVSSDPTELPGTLRLSTHAITMSTAPHYNMVQLTAVLRSVAGAPLAGIPRVTFTSSDSSVRVDTTGLLTARSAKTGVLIIASLVVQGVRVADTARVSVTNVTNPPTFRQIKLALPPGSDTTMPVSNALAARYGFLTKTLQVGALDSNGTKIPNTGVAVSTSDRGQAYFNGTPSFVTGNKVTLQGSSIARVGVPFTVYVSATVYGVTLQDSLRITVVNQSNFVFTVKDSIPPGGASPIFTLGPIPTQAIVVGGWIWWSNMSSDSLDIVFDDSTVASPDLAPQGMNSGGGNIASFKGNSVFGDTAATRSRQFLQAGRFHFTSPRTGISGTVIVQ